MSQVYGEVYLEKNKGTGVGQFQFVVTRDQVVNVEVGTPVAVDGPDGVTIGMVTDPQVFGHGAGPSAAGLSGASSAIEVAPTTIATVQTFLSPAMRPVGPGAVRAATVEEIQKATGYDRMDYRIPAGCIRNSGTFVPVYFDGLSLLGPESAHLMVGGLSGQAAKTSYMSFVMRAALASDHESVAAIVFNVKGDDMLYLDQEPDTDEFTEDDCALYEATGVPATPFEDVTVFAPPQPGTRTPASSRTDAELLEWDLVDVWDYLRYLSPGAFQGDMGEKTWSFIEDYRATFLRSGQPGHAAYRTFAGITKFFDQVLAPNEDGESDASPWEGHPGHHRATLRRLSRTIGLAPKRTGGLLALDHSTDATDVPVKHWRPGQVIVVDIAGLKPEVQALVVGRTLDRILRASEDGELGVDHLIVMTDELNAFAPQIGAESLGVKKTLQKISTQGRYAGISLFGAAQKLSKIDELVRDNAATRALGITADGELASGVYGRMSAGLHEQIATMPRGQVAITHYAYRSPIVVQFPRPAWKTGRSTTKRSKVTDSVIGTHKRIVDSIGSDAAEDIISGATSTQDAKLQLEKSWDPDMSTVVVHEPVGVDPSNPFALEP